MDEHVKRDHPRQWQKYLKLRRRVANPHIRSSITPCGAKPKTVGAHYVERRGGPPAVLLLDLNNVNQYGPELFYENRLSGSDLEGNPDFVKLAQAYRVKALRIRRPADVDRILAEANEVDGPCVVVAEVVKEDNVFPMIPAGASIAEMLIEKPKRVLEKPTGST